MLSLEEDGTVHLANRFAREMLNVQIGMKLSKQSAELGKVFEAFMQAPRELWQQQLPITRANGEVRTLLVRMVPQRVGGGKVVGVVVTFDDITPLMTAQKVAAWSDVARRLAHEIKNPLTPIQLSAERLKRKYLASIAKNEQDLFAQLTETIVRQTDDMRRMVNEFSDFARMPAPQMVDENLIELIEDVLVLQKTGRSDIDFSTDYQIDRSSARLLCDRSHVNRALTNVLENAVNAVEERTEGGAQGQIKIVVKMSQGDRLDVSVLDNGKGLPLEVETESLFDPYVTTRKKGTGLGLAIVRRVMEEHEGQVRLLRRAAGGTEVELSFPALAPARGASATEAATTAAAAKDEAPRAVAKAAAKPASKAAHTTVKTKRTRAKPKPNQTT